jgi:uncharacterized Fe-S cluster-containing protein
MHYITCIKKDGEKVKDYLSKLKQVEKAQNPIYFMDLFKKGDILEYDFNEFNKVSKDWFVFD